jgi:hypothetical protein
MVFMPTVTHRILGTAHFESNFVKPTPHSLSGKGLTGCGVAAARRGINMSPRCAADMVC